MRSLLVTIPLSVCVIGSALFGADELPLQTEVEVIEQDDLSVEQDWVPQEQDWVPQEPAEPPTDAVGCLQAVQQAWDPATAEDAYQRGVQAGADPLTINQSYVREMIALGLPGQAEDAAEQIIAVFPQDGVAWAVLAYADAARNDTTAALAEMATAVDWAPDDPFVLGVAGKLMAWYRFLGDPSELPAGLPERLDEIHAQLWPREAYRTAFEAAYAYYESQASVPIAEYPQEIAEPAFEEIAYTPAVWTSYYEPVYSGFTVPCFSVSYLVPRVGCYVVHDRPVHGYLRFHIGDRCDRYHGRFHARRLHWERNTRCVAYHVEGHVRLAPRPGLHLPRVHARYDKVMFSSPHAASPMGATNPPPPTPRHVANLLSGRSGRGQPGYASAPPTLTHRTDSKPHSSGFLPRIEPLSRDAGRVSRPARTDARPESKPQARPADQSKPGISGAQQHEFRIKTDQTAPQAEPRRPESELKASPSQPRRPIIEATRDGALRQRTESKTPGQPQSTVSPPKTEPSRPQEVQPQPSQAKSGPRIEGRGDSRPHARSEVQSRERPEVTRTLRQGGHSRDTSLDSKPQVTPKPAPDNSPQRKADVGGRAGPVSPKADPKPQPRPAQVPQPKVEQRPQVKPQPAMSVPQRERTPEARPNPKTQPAPEAKAPTRDHSSAQAKPQPPSASPQANPKPQARPEPKPQPKAQPAGQSRPAAAPEAKPQPASPKPAAGAKPPSAQPKQQDSAPKPQTAAPSPKPEQKPTPAAQPQPKPQTPAPQTAKATPQSPQHSSAPAPQKAPSGPQPGQSPKRGK